jgi:hypothetical protein
MRTINDLIYKVRVLKMVWMKMENSPDIKKRRSNVTMTINHMLIPKRVKKNKGNMQLMKYKLAHNVNCIYL